MTLTIKDAEDAYLSGRADFVEWQEAFMRQWSAPIRKALMAPIWQQLPPEVHAELKRMAPEAYDIIDREVGGNQDALRR